MYTTRHWHAAATHPLTRTHTLETSSITLAPCRSLIQPQGIDQFHKFVDTAQGGVLPGQSAFVLWDTFGFPVDLTQLMAEEAGLTVDLPGFAAALEEAKELSRAGQKKAAAAGIKFEAEATAALSSRAVPLTDDSPKYAGEDVRSTVLAILSRDGYVQSTAVRQPAGPPAEGPGRPCGEKHGWLGASGRTLPEPCREASRGLPGAAGSHREPGAAGSHREPREHRTQAPPAPR